MLNYEYEGKIYNKNNLSDLVTALDKNNVIDMCSKTSYCIRGISGQFGDWNTNEFLDKLVLYKFIKNDEEYERLDAIWLEDLKIKRAKEAKGNKEEGTNYIDDHYESVRRDAIRNMGVYHY